MLNFTVNYEGKEYQPHTFWDNEVRVGDLFVVTDNSSESFGVHLCTWYSKDGGMVEYKNGAVYETDCLKLTLISK